METKTQEVEKKEPKFETTEESIKVGKRLFQIRLAKGLKEGFGKEMPQRDFAELFNNTKSQSYISDLENGKPLSGYYREQYILKVGANPDYIDNGTGSPLLEKKFPKNLSPEEVIVAARDRKRGNCFFVGIEQAAQFINTGGRVKRGFMYPGDERNLGWFKITSPEMGNDYPVNCTVVGYSVFLSALLRNKPYVFLTGDELLFRYYGGEVEGKLKLTTPNGTDLLLDPTQITQLFYIEQRLIPAV